MLKHLYVQLPCVIVAYTVGSSLVVVKIGISRVGCSKRPIYRLLARFQLYAEIAQLVEHDLAKVGVASSNLVFRSKSRIREVGHLAGLISRNWTKSGRGFESLIRYFFLKANLVFGTGCSPTSFPASQINKSILFGGYLL